MPTVIIRAESRDVRFPLPPGEGTDAIHTNPVYSYGVCLLHTDQTPSGVGLAFTLGGGNQELCSLIETLAAPLAGREIEEVMADFRTVFKQIADEPQYRWLGPHKGLVHLALAAITNACFDLWAKARGVPLWQLLLDLSDSELLALLDLSYVSDELSDTYVLDLLKAERESRNDRMGILKEGYRGYDTSVGWMGFSDAKITERVKAAKAQGFAAFKLKVGAAKGDSDLRRAYLLREIAGDDATVMLDANQAWDVEEAISMMERLADINPYWIEEPTHPDDVLGHARIAAEVAPIQVATGEHVANRVGFKNLMQAGGMHFVQADAVRLGGVSEFLTVSLLAKKFDLPVVPHVGDMGQIHQHLVLFNHIGLNLEPLLLEYIPHLRDRFVHPALVEGGRYITPEAPGASSDLVAIN